MTQESTSGTLQNVIAALRFAGSRGATLVRKLGLPLPSRAKLVYQPDYQTPVRDVGARHAFDVRRAVKILEQLYKVGILSPSQVLTPAPPAREDLLLVHPPEYLQELAHPRRLAELLFIPQAVLQDSALYGSFLIQTAGTILAAERAVLERLPIFNLGGGFHHAQRDRAEGFCAINDVAVAIRCLQRDALVEEVLVVDLDYHQGNGTALIFSKDERIFTLSVHGQSWARIEGKHNNLDVELPSGAKDSVYLDAVRRALEGTLGRFKPQLAIYLAGVDPYVEDTLGDFAVSEEGLLERDLFVYKTLVDAGIPLAVVLAGGYSLMAWTLHYNFIFSVLAGQRIAPTHRPSNIAAHYRRVMASISPTELRLGGTEISQEDATAVCQGQSEGRLFMGYYSPSGVRLVLERYGLLELLREMGFDRLLVCVRTEDPEKQMLRIYFERQDPGHLLIELVMRFRTLVTPAAAVAEGIQESFRMMSIEWLLMQDPRRAFSLSRQRFPGQQHPGLGLGRWMVELLRMMVERLGADGLMNIPQHYHNAYLYSKQMLFFDPVAQGYLEAMKRDLEHLPLIETSLAIDGGLLRDAVTGETLTWEGQPQVMPVQASLNAYFVRPSYIHEVARARSSHYFRLAPAHPLTAAD